MRASAPQIKRFITVSWNGRTFNEPSDFGPKTRINGTLGQEGPPFSDTVGLQEAIDFAYREKIDAILMEKGLYVIFSELRVNPNADFKPKLIGNGSIIMAADWEHIIWDPDARPRGTYTEDFIEIIDVHPLMRNQIDLAKKIAKYEDGFPYFEALDQLDELKRKTPRPSRRR